MSKRKLTRQQAHRVQRIQDERLERARRREAAASALLESGELAAEEPGLVIAHYGTQLDIEALAGERAGQVFRCHLRANLEHLVTGDRVVWQAAPRREDGREAIGVVTALEERRSLLVRPDPYGKLKPVAANIDRILLVISPFPEPSALLVDRYLVACALTGIRPVILLNKADLVTPELAPVMDALLAPYAAIGYEVRRVSAAAGDMADLAALIGQQTVVFVGQSGVGKSSLINVLLPAAGQLVRDISEGSKLGQHTTTTARLFHLPGGGDLVDSPGVREFQLWHIDEQQLEDSYRDLARFRGQCRFRDCRHLREPGCALRDAVARGELSGERLDNFLAIRAGLRDAPATR